jgi:hypothetical protein
MPFHITPSSLAPSSFNDRYKWPDAARFTPDNSPRMRTKEKRSSTVRFNSAEISVIERVLRCRRALAFATSAPERSSSESKEAGMNILLLGSGGREHALAWRLSQSSVLANGGKLLPPPAIRALPNTRNW